MTVTSDWTCWCRIIRAGIARKVLKYQVHLVRFSLVYICFVTEAIPWSMLDIASVPPTSSRSAADSRSYPALKMTDGFVWVDMSMSCILFASKLLYVKPIELSKHSISWNTQDREGIDKLDDTVRPSAHCPEVQFALACLLQMPRLA